MNPTLFPWGLGVGWSDRRGHAGVSGSWKTGQGEGPQGFPEERRWAKHFHYSACCQANISHTNWSHYWPSSVKSSVSMDLSDQKKTRMKLKKFLTRRPTYQAVRDKGYIKGRAAAPVGVWSCWWARCLGPSDQQMALWTAALVIGVPQTRCLAAVWLPCASRRTRRCLSLSRRASSTWKTQVSLVQNSCLF